MKFWVQLFALSLLGAIGLTIGFLWRGKAANAEQPLSLSEPGRDQAMRPDPSTRLKVQSRRKLARSPIPDDSPLATKLARDLSLASSVTRWLYWLEAIENATLSDFPRLAVLANDNASATRILASRWVQLDLGH